MSELPTLWDGGLPSRQVVRAARAMEKADEAVLSHFLTTEVARQCEAIDNEVLGDVVKASLVTELEVYDWAMGRVGGSPVKARLVAEKIALLSNTNSSRIARRFGR
ncbi:MAG: hypothetical protein JSS68_11670 [Actinobacteria bacterium]|nr:hypothetical protein [Actinomycetota bacterium]